MTKVRLKLQLFFHADATQISFAVILSHAVCQNKREARKVGRHNKNLHSELLIGETMEESAPLENSSVHETEKLHLYSEHVN